MFMRFRFRSIATLLVALSLPAFGQLGKIKDKITGKPPAEDPAKNQLRYEALKQFATDRYQKDLNFRDDVDQAYEQVMREHSQRAYDRNTSVSSYIATVREDRWRIHENLYDNLVVQDHINRIGQKLVPAESERALAFKVIPDPTPLAETLSTGTVYVSTGLISIVDSESQLAYVLAHEMAHVMLEHWKERVILDSGQRVYAEEQAAKQARFTFIAGLMGAGLGAATGLPGSGLGGRIISANQGADLGTTIGQAVGFFLYKPLIVNWDQVEEDAADDMAFKAVLNANYDVREVPVLYATMLKVATRDARVGLGFLGSRRRVEQRMDKAKDLIANAYKAEIEAKLKDGFLSSSAEHRNLMAELKRDNGIMAYYSDMFEMARKNLSDAVAIRDNDPAAHYYYAKVLKLVGRTPDDEKLARDEFYKAVKTDTRDENFGSHLHLALMMARDRGADKGQITQELDAYVTDYAKLTVEDRIMRSFPPNMETIYEYMTLFGDSGWRPKPPDLRAMEAEYNLVNNTAGTNAPPPSGASSGTAASTLAPKGTPGATAAPKGTTTVVPVKIPAVPAVIKKQ
jgi:predicted Zn-dependent protease